MAHGTVVKKSARHRNGPRWRDPQHILCKQSKVQDTTYTSISLCKHWVCACVHTHEKVWEVLNQNVKSGNPRGVEVGRRTGSVGFFTWSFLYHWLFFNEHRFALQYITFIFWMFMYLFVYSEREREREGASGGRAEREGERESQASLAPPAQSPTQDSNSWTVRSWPEPKSRVGRLTDWATQAPLQDKTFKWFF